MQVFLLSLSGYHNHIQTCLQVIVHLLNTTLQDPGVTEQKTTSTGVPRLNDCPTKNFSATKPITRMVPRAVSELSALRWRGGRYWVKILLSVHKPHTVQWSQKLRQINLNSILRLSFLKKLQSGLELPRYNELLDKTSALHILFQI